MQQPSKFNFETVYYVTNTSQCSDWSNVSISRLYTFVAFNEVVTSKHINVIFF